MTNPNNSAPHPDAEFPATPGESEVTGATAPEHSSSLPAEQSGSPFEPAPSSGAAVEETKAERKARERAQRDAGKVKGSFAASTWIALIVGFLLLIVLIIFILQNQQKVPMNFLNWSAEFPAGIAYLISAIAGALIMALVGMWRMFELRRQVRKQARANN
ncbi:lipopolysaccharide assembly LapA domain-containing protein [Corynebacterium sp.]|uniref:LapA family protein n=1 Tax=Corynebacterium sp. TaxID=1720 RepID=UPI0026DA955A|nr:lipopolysaccharide assembly protein LapA domain-containing protein [Corynebacterium sp.]MDO5032494.1 lipopolysaccharide assembly protein LapA domain-containing protein [Corynebacterium sp.]